MIPPRIEAHSENVQAISMGKSISSVDNPVLLLFPPEPGHNDGTPDQRHATKISSKTETGAQRGEGIFKNTTRDWTKHL